MELRCRVTVGGRNVTAMNGDESRRTASVFYGDPDKIAEPDPTLSPELLDFVTEAYGLSVTSPVDLGGSFNLNVLLDQRVLRVYGPWVGSERLADLQQIRGALLRRGVPIPHLVPAVDGSTWCRFGDCVLEVEHYVAGSAMNGVERLRTGMFQLARLHTLLAELDSAHPPPLANHLPQERAVEATAAATTSIREHDPSPIDERYCQVAEELAALLPVHDLPTQLVHGDYWDNNVLFRDETLVAVLDFDFAGVRPRVDDVALPLGYLMQTGQPVSEIRDLLAAYDAGADQPLTAPERQALPFAMARAALFFLQYHLLPADPAHRQHLRQEFRQQRGPACEWWLTAFHRGTISAATFR